MNILRANLKHLYQRRGLWFWYLIILCQIPAAYFILLSRAERYLGYLIISYFSGLLAGSVQRELLSKPFSFCLPGHSQIPRKFVLMVGIVVNGLLGFVFMFYPGLEFPYVLLVVLAGGIVGMMFYLLFAGLILLDLEKKKLGVVLAIIITCCVVFLKWDVIVQEMIVTSPLIVISLGLLFCWLVWRWLGSESLSRKYCGKMAMSMFDGWNKEKMSKYKIAKIAEKEKKKPCSTNKMSFGVDRFFISLFRRAEAGSRQQYIWGGLCKSFQVMPSQRKLDWMRYLILILPIICFLCYMPSGYGNIIFAMPGIMVIHISTGVHSSLLISGGRRQRFWSALVVAVVTGILITVVVVLLAMATNLLAGVMPQLTIRGHEFVFIALNMRFAPVPLLMIPLTFTIGLIFHKKPMLAMFFAIVIFQIFFALGMVGGSTIMNWPIWRGAAYVMITVQVYADGREVAKLTTLKSK